MEQRTDIDAFRVAAGFSDTIAFCVSDQSPLNPDFVSGKHAAAAHACHAQSVAVQAGGGKDARWY